MSLWTPDGERPVGRPEPAAADPAPSAAPEGLRPEDLSEEERAELAAMQAELDDVRKSVLETPASVVIANHAMGIYELAAIHLTTSEPQLPEAVLAIDALSALVGGLEGRLGDAEPTLREALGHLKNAYLEVSARRA
ncbi:MAG: hypothetical protein Q8K58_03450 [Acidimicrobiales bacterium]|nr:hypothetical protein [Acidimicrobiales bacterium]